MAIFDSLRAEIDAADEGSIPYISCWTDQDSRKTLNFWKVSNITLHDQHALIESRSETDVQFFRASDLGCIAVHYVVGSLLDYFRNELPDFWKSLGEETQLAILEASSS